MKEKFYGFVMLGLAALTSCSSEQSVLDSVKLSDLSNKVVRLRIRQKKADLSFIQKKRRKLPRLQ